jgi:hypothetical protein
MRNTFMLREVSGEKGGRWVFDRTQTAGTSSRGTPYFGWRKEADDVPTAWVLEHRLMETDNEEWQRSEAADRAHLNRSFDLAQREGILASPFFLQMLDRAAIITETDDYLFVISELADATLHTVMAAGEVALGDRAQIELNVGAALESIHSLGIVHSDVTPGNIFRAGGRWKLGDLGAAVEVGQAIHSLPHNRRYVPSGFDFDVAAAPELDRGCLSNIIAASGSRLA